MFHCAVLRQVAEKIAQSNRAYIVVKCTKVNSLLHAIQLQSKSSYTGLSTTYIVVGVKINNDRFFRI